MAVALQKRDYWKRFEFPLLLTQHCHRLLDSSGVLRVRVGVVSGIIVSSVAVYDTACVEIFSCFTSTPVRLNP